MPDLLSDQQCEELIKIRDELLELRQRVDALLIGTPVHTPEKGIDYFLSLAYQSVGSLLLQRSQRRRR